MGLSVEPVVNERDDFGGSFPERTQDPGQRGFQFVQIGVPLDNDTFFLTFAEN